MLELFLTAICILLLLGYAVVLFRVHKKKHRLAMLPAIIATVLLLIFETVINSSRFFVPHAGKLLLLSQALTGTTWLVFSLAYGRLFTAQMQGVMNKVILACSALPVLAALLMPVSAFYYQTDFYLEPVLFLEPQSFFFYLIVVLSLLIAIGNLESTLRNCLHTDRWRIKLALLGAGTIMASLIMFFSQAMLFKSLNMLYLPLRNLTLILGLMLLFFAEQQRQSGKVTISRKVAFHSIASILAGMYLVVLGLFREGIHIFGGTFDYYLLTSVLFITVLAGLLLLLSNSMRRRFSVWLQRNLYNEKYDYKTQWLHFSEQLSSTTDNKSLIMAVLRGFCETFGLMGASFIPVENNAQGRIGKGLYHEIAEPVDARLQMEDFAVLLTRPGGPEDINKVLPEVPQPLASYLVTVKASLIMPVLAAEDPEGIIIMGPSIKGSERYDMEDYDLMEAMGRQIGLCVRSFRLGDELVTAKEMEALNKLSAFVMHDLKNQVYALSLLTDNAQRFIAEPEFQQDMLETLGNTVANMKILITQLTQLPSQHNLRLEEVDLYELAHKARNQVPGANVRISGQHAMVHADAEQIIKVFSNLYLNAVEAGGDHPIIVEIMEKGVPMFRCRDHAGGISEEAINNGLFKPFNTTKQRGMGIGLYHCLKIMEAHGGKILIDNNPPEGCTFTVLFSGENARPSVQKADVTAA